VLVAVGRTSRILTRPGNARLGTRFDLPLLLFLVSAALGAWLAFDPPAASAKFWQIVGGLALFDSLVFAPEEATIFGRRFSPVRGLLLLLPALIAAYFLLGADWSTAMGKAPRLDPAMRWFAWWQAAFMAGAWLPQSIAAAATTHALHPNVAGGLIAALIPLQIAAASQTARDFAPPAARAAAWLLVALSFLGLLMTASRGAWIALASVGAVWLLWRLRGRRWSRRAWLVLAGLLGLAMATGAALVWTWGPLVSPGGRVELLHNSVELALDTPFTGIGLGKGIFQMAYSSYVLLLHVGHTIHSHVLPLNIWLEQGLLGLAAFVWLLVAAARARYVSPEWRAAGLAALGVILIHGLVDDAFYGSRGVVLLFVPLAVLAREELRFSREPRTGKAAAWLPRSKGPQVAALAPRTQLAGLTLAATAILILALLPPVRAAFQANLGAIAQTRAELSVYRWPDWPIQDAVRRSPSVDLGPAIARYRAALALDPGNAAANRRLGQIELSLGEYESARTHLEAAYAATSDARATRQLLGEAYAISGDPGRAPALWRGIDLGQGQIALRVWWYEHTGEKEKARKLLEAEAMLKAGAWLPHSKE
jgi:tetratricopeptide (TPR) repeat protein